MKRLISIGLLVCLSVGLLAGLSMPARAMNDPEQRLVKLAQDLVLAKHPEWAGLNIKVTLKFADKLIGDLRGMDDNASMSVMEGYENVNPVGSVILPVAVISGAETKKMFVRAQVEVFKSVVAAADTIKRNETITAEQLKLMEKDIAMVPQKYYEKTEQLVGTEAKTNIPENSTLYDWMVREKPLVRRGDAVMLLVTSDNVMVKTKGTALTDGYLGKEVVVKRADVNKTLKGNLISKGEVEVKL